MANFASLFRQFILRSLARQRVRAVVALLGIVLGVAVMIAIRLANRSAVDAFRAAVEYVQGDATLRIRGAAGRFDETLLRDLFWLRQYGAASPVIEAYALLAPPEPAAAPGKPAGRWQGRREMLRVLGADVLEDSALRTYRLLKVSAEQRDPTPTELLRVLTDPQAIIVTEKFARRHGLQIGDRLELVFDTRPRPFCIRGLLLDEGPGRALEGNFALLDIAAAQWATGRLGQIDAVDLKVRGDIEPDAAQAAIAARLPPGLSVERPETQVGRSETMIAAFHFNLAALSGVALFVGLFLIYNTVSVSVASRREEIGMLQAVGAGRATVLGLFLAEAGALALLGSLLGLVLGSWLASSAVQATAQTVQTFFVAEAARASARTLTPTWLEALLAVGVTVPLALLAAALPAWEAARISPLEVMRGAEHLVRGFRVPWRQLGLAALLAGGGWLLTRLGPVAGRPVWGFGAQLLLTLSGALLVPTLLWLVCRAARRPLARALPVLSIECELAASNLLGAISRVSVSVAALAVSLAMLVAISVMVGSFRDTVVYWLSGTLKADLFVRSAMITSSLTEARLDPEAVAAIRRDPDVIDTGWLQSRQVPYDRVTIRLAAADVATILRQNTAVFKAPADAPAVVARGLAGDTVLISESFSLRFGKGPGDPLVLPTPTGPHEFTVTAVYYDYASNQGTVLIDGGTFARHFSRDDPARAPTNLSIYVRPGADPDAVRDRLNATLGNQQALYFVTNAAIRREALRVFDSTFAITYALQFIAVIVAGLGVISTLITLIYQRQREIAVMSLIGATPPQIRRTVTLEAVIIGLVSQGAGVLMGLVLALVLIYVINVQSFGWTIQFHLPVWFLVQSTLLILAATAAAGLYPATRAANIQAIDVVREE